MKIINQALFFVGVVTLFVAGPTALARGLPPQAIHVMKEFRLPAPVATESYAVSTPSQGGYQPDARSDVDGFKNVLKLRADVEGQWGGRAPAADKYYDLSCYEQALTVLIAAGKNSTPK